MSKLWLSSLVLLLLLPATASPAAPTPKSVYSSYQGIKAFVSGTRTENLIQHSLVRSSSAANLVYKTPRTGSAAVKTRQLLSVAQSKGDISMIEMIHLGDAYRALGNKAPRLLARCLNTPRCHHASFIKSQQRSFLHQKMSEAMPHLSPTAVNHKVGELNERVMNRYYTASGWRQLPGEVGRNGIDGLFIKYSRDGSIRDVLVSESKYNFSPLGNTRHGKQMSRQWVLKKVDDLYRSTGNARYAEIRRFVERDDYRSILWRLRPSADGSGIFVIQRQRVMDNAGVLTLEGIRGGYRMVVDRAANQTIDILKPGNNFHAGIARNIQSVFDDIVQAERRRVAR